MDFTRIEFNKDVIVNAFYDEWIPACLVDPFEQGGGRGLEDILETRPEFYVFR